ncbi:MAG TPA: inositol monophosphatase [Dehalococcoidia bacterium]|nr:inositol monophosphatase [Dehalococcoidia bacterium]
MTPDEITRRRRVAEDAARAGGAVHMKARGGLIERHVKDALGDFATQVDFDSHNAAKAVILAAFPGEAVVGEEDVTTLEELGRHADDGCWFIDPLDGTLEYAHSSPLFSCIVSYVVGRETQACAIYFAAFNELFSAGLGEGATLNGAAIHTSGLKELERATLTTTTRRLPLERAPFFAELVTRFVTRIGLLRMPGPPSLGAAYLASGRSDLHAMLGGAMNRLAPADQAPKPQIWETAAFILLVREAGGAVASIDGSPPDVLGYNAYAASEELLQAFLELLNQP